MAQFFPDNSPLEQRQAKTNLDIEIITVLIFPVHRYWVMCLEEAWRPGEGFRYARGEPKVRKPPEMAILELDYKVTWI
jgi:hypothetical protein